MLNNLKPTKFHGMAIVSDQDCISVRGKHVLEVNSSGDLVVRYYDKQGVEDDNPVVFGLLDFVQTDLKEENITGKIKRDIGINSLVVSQGAANLITNLASNCSL